MDDSMHLGYGPWRIASAALACGYCGQPLQEGDPVQAGPDGNPLGECCGVAGPPASRPADQLPGSAHPDDVDGLALLRRIRRSGHRRVVHHHGVRAPAEFLADLPTSVRAEAHLWLYNPGLPAHIGRVAVRVLGEQMTVWRYRNHPKEACAEYRAALQVVSIVEAIDVLVALGVLTPRWSSPVLCG